MILLRHLLRQPFDDAGRIEARDIGDDEKRRACEAARKAQADYVAKLRETAKVERMDKPADAAKPAEAAKQPEAPKQPPAPADTKKKKAIGAPTRGAPTNSKLVGATLVVALLSAKQKRPGVEAGRFLCASGSITRCRDLHPRQARRRRPGAGRAAGDAGADSAHHHRQRLQRC